MYQSEKEKASVDNQGKYPSGRSLTCVFGNDADCFLTSCPKLVFTGVQICRAGNRSWDNKPIYQTCQPSACAVAPTNPGVRDSATAARTGTPTPVPSVFRASPWPWVPGTPTVTVGEIPAWSTELHVNVEPGWARSRWKCQRQFTVTVP